MESRISKSVRNAIPAVESSSEGLLPGFDARWFSPVLFCFVVLFGDAACLTPSVCFAQSAGAAIESDPPVQFEGQFRITWGGAMARQFRGSISLDSGQIDVVQNLSLQPDATGTILPSGTGQLKIQPHSKATFGGVVIQAECPLDAKVSIEIRNPSAAPFRGVFSVNDLLKKTHIEAIDELGNRLALERPVEDQLQIRTSSRNAVLETLDIWPASVRGNFTTLTPGKHRIRIRRKGVLPERPVELIHEAVVEVDEVGSFGDVPFQLVVPDLEGVYELELCIVPERSYLASFLPADDQVLRRYEFVAIDPAERQPSKLIWKEVQRIQAIDAATPGFLSWISPYLRAQSIPETVKRVTPLSSTLDAVLSHGELEERELQLPNSGSKKCLVLGPESWLAIPLTELEPGQPHRLRIRTPVDWPNAVIASIKPLGMAGEVSEFATLGSDYKIDTSTRELLRHSALQPEEQTGLRSTEVVFWPASEQSLLLLSNPSSERLASVLDIAVDASSWEPGEIAEVAANPSVSAEPERLAGVYLDKPLLGVWLGTQRIRDPGTGRWLENWSTWHLACTRMMHYLDLLEANLLVMKVQADGGAIFPSRSLQPSPQYDNGTFFSDGRNAGIKDGVALLLKHMERSNRKLVLALDLDSKLPGVELQAQGTTGVHQRRLARDSQTRRTTEYRYDPLHPDVQAEIERIIREIVSSYGDTKAFGGVQLQLSKKSVLLFKGDLWLPSDRTIRQFESSTNIAVPKESAAFREFLKTKDGQEYLKWRGERLSSFLARLGGIVAGEEIGQVAGTESSDRSRLYLHAGSLWNQTPRESDFLNPKTINRIPQEFLLAFGLDLDSLSESDEVILVQSEVEVSESVDADEWVRQISRRIGLNFKTNHSLASASVLLQTPSAHRIPGLDVLSEATGQEFSDVVYPIRIESQSFLNRALLQQTLQQELSFVALGAWLPVGAELSELKANLTTLRTLPVAQFQDVPLSQTNSSGLVRVRYAALGEKSYVQIVNATPWTEEVSLTFAGGSDELFCEVLGDLDLTLKKEVSGRSPVWKVQVPGNRIVGLQLSQKLVVSSASRSCSGNVSTVIADELSVLEAILSASADPTRQEIATDISGDFEQSTKVGLPSGWSSSEMPGVTVRASNHLPHSGRQSLEIASSNKGKTRTWLHSPNIPIPVTGRLTIQAWLRSPADRSSTLARIALVGRAISGDRFERSMLVGSKVDPSQQIPNDWGTRPFTLDVGDIPLDELESLYVSIELVGAGRLWVDDVKVLRCWLHPNERTFLQGRLLVAKRALKAGDPAAAEQLLDGPWARYLRRVHPDMQDNKGRVAQAAPLSIPIEGSAHSADQSNWNASPSIFETIRDSLLQRWIR